MVKNDSHFIGTCFHAIFASNTCFLIYQDHPFRRGVSCPCRADALAWSVFTMVALKGNIFTIIGRIFSAFLLLDPVECFSIFQAILILAGQPAGMTSNTFCSVYGNTVSWHFILPSRSSTNNRPEVIQALTY